MVKELEIFRIIKEKEKMGTHSNASHDLFDKFEKSEEVSVNMSEKNIIIIDDAKNNIPKSEDINKRHIPNDLRFKDLVEKTGAGVAISDVKGGFTYVNKAICKMIGYTKEELIGKKFVDFLYPDDKKKIMKFFTVHLKTLIKSCI